MADLATELERLSQAKTDITAAIKSKGVYVPNGTLFSGMADLIKSIREGIINAGVVKTIDLGGDIPERTSFSIKHGLHNIHQFFFWRQPNTGIVDNSNAALLFSGILVHQLGAEVPSDNALMHTPKYITEIYTHSASGVAKHDAEYNIEFNEQNQEIIFPTGHPGKMQGIYYWLAIE